MDRSRRTQNPYATADWLKPYMPARCDECGQPLAPAGSDWASQLYTTAYAPMMDNLNRMWSSMAQPWGGLPQPWGNLAQTWTAPAPAPGTAWPGMRTDPHAHHHHHHQHGQRNDCGCEPGNCDGCGSDRCDCRCCITDADLVIYARLGERRVVPITVENPRRRERQIKLELSNFTGRSGAAAKIQARIVGQTEFTLAACQEHESLLLIEADPVTDKVDNTPGNIGNTDATNAAATRFNIPDIEDCQVFYADLRVEGCETRPVRIALALLPRSCDGFRVDCGCNCC